MKCVNRNTFFSDSNFDCTLPSVLEVICSQKGYIGWILPKMSQTTELLILPVGICCCAVGEINVFQFRWKTGILQFLLG